MTTAAGGRTRASEQTCTPDQTFTPDGSRTSDQSRDAGRVALWLLLGLAGAVGVRRGIDGWPGATSVVAAAAFTVLLLGLSLLGRLGPTLPPGPAPGRITRPGVAVLAGLGGAAALCTGPLLRHLAGPGAQLPGSRLPVWVAAVAGVAVAEEVLLRGVLWRAVTTWAGGRAAAPWIALAVTTGAFALLHVPFYGVGSLPVDLAAGVLLGALRHWTGSVTAPAVAHLAADLAGWWLQ